MTQPFLQGTTRLAVTRILGLDPDPRFAAEFATDPFAAHSAGLARLLAVMRARLTRPWVAALPEAGHYRLILIGGRLGTHCYADNVRHPTLASVEIAAFAWRWQALFGQPCPLEKTA